MAKSLEASTPHRYFRDVGHDVSLHVSISCYSSACSEEWAITPPPLSFLFALFFSSVPPSPLVKIDIELSCCLTVWKVSRPFSKHWTFSLSLSLSGRQLFRVVHLNFDFLGSKFGWSEGNFGFEGGGGSSLLVSFRSLRIIKNYSPGN